MPAPTLATTNTNTTTTTTPASSPSSCRHLETDAYPRHACATRPIQIYLGGSFDPVHNSHLALLAHVYQHLHTAKPLSKLSAYFMPTSRSPLKDNSSRPEHRMAMLQLAIDEMTAAKAQTAISPADFGICDHEIWQTPPTYSIDTLRALRQANPEASLVFVIGADNVQSLPQWRDGDRLIEFAHLWVIPRDHLQTHQHIANLLPNKLKSALTEHIEDLKYAAKGHIYIDSHRVDPISSSAIRQAITEGSFDIAKSALPRSVYSYIMKNNLYHSY